MLNIPFIVYFPFVILPQNVFLFKTQCVSYLLDFCPAFPTLKRGFGHFVYVAHEPGSKFTQSEATLLCGEVYGGTLPKTPGVENLLDIHIGGWRQTESRKTSFPF